MSQITRRLKPEDTEVLRKRLPFEQLLAERELELVDLRSKLRGVRNHRTPGVGMGLVCHL